MLDFLCKESYDLRDFVALITFLRSPGGCPWDQVQTHESIRRNFLEETYEACEAIDAGDTAHLKEELGDVLMQVLFHTDIEREAGHFDIDDVADAARSCRRSWWHISRTRAGTGSHNGSRFFCLSENPNGVFRQKAYSLLRAEFVRRWHTNSTLAA